MYDDLFQIVMGIYDLNDDVSMHIWESLVTNNTKNLKDLARREQEPIPQLH